MKFSPYMIYRFCMSVYNSDKTFFIETKNNRVDNFIKWEYDVTDRTIIVF
ncbi:MAG: hypothetical protein K0S47_4222 [Herbinix sp.]|nr:hypothetical protein [Herbinix sp.]